MIEHLKSQVDSISEHYGFQAKNVEKMLRLREILMFIYTYNTPDFQLVLKGGTALNLLYNDLKRLSVDIDLDMHTRVDVSKEDVEKLKELNKQFIENFAFKNKYEISEDSKRSFTLDSFRLRYTTLFHGQDIIKIDINYSDREHICTPVFKDSTTKLGMPFPVCTMEKNELIATKMSAFISRCTGRDMYDVYQIVKHNEINDINKIRNYLTFYCTIGGKDNKKVNDLIDNTNKTITTLNYSKLRDTVLQLSSSYEKINVDEMKITLTDFVNNLRIDGKAQEYENLFYNGIYKPEIILGDNNKVKNHPMAKWKIMNIRKELYSENDFEMSK